MNDSGGYVEFAALLRRPVLRHVVSMECDHDSELVRFRLVTEVTPGRCKQIRRLGNKHDGGYDVCISPRSVRPQPGHCLVYSFGSVR